MYVYVLKYIYICIMSLSLCMYIYIYTVCIQNMTYKYMLTYTCIRTCHLWGLSFSSSCRRSIRHLPSRLRTPCRRRQSSTSAEAILYHAESQRTREEEFSPSCKELSVQRSSAVLFERLFEGGVKRQKTLDAGEEAKNFKPSELSLQQYTDILE